MRKVLLFALSLLGLFDSAYLWWVYTSPSRPLLCLGTGCDVVRASSYAVLWGHSLPAYGVLMYAAIALITFATPLAGARFEILIRWAAAGISGAGFLFSIYLTGVEAFTLHAWCVWCVVSAIAITLIFLLALFDLRAGAPESDAGRRLAAARRLAVTAVLAVAAGTPAFVLLARSNPLPPLPPPPIEKLAEHLFHPDSHTAGSPGASVTVVEFGDFQCPVCGTMQPTVRAIRTKYGDQIRFVFRQFPIEVLHMHAESAAEASECAAEQGRFWGAADKLYQEQADLSEIALFRYASEMGLDKKKFTQCFDSGATAARVRRDLEDGKAIGVRATPTFFVNQTKVEGPMDVAQFSQLIEAEMARQAAPSAKSQTAAPTLELNAARPSQKETSSRRPAPDGHAASSSTPDLLGKSGGVFTQFQNSELTCSEDEAKRLQPALIRTVQVRQLLAGAAKPLFVDVRAARDFSSGRIRGAINVPVEEIERRWNQLPKDRDIVLYESGNSQGDICASSRAAGRILLAHGFAPERVMVYQDGLAAWVKEGFPVER